MNKKLLAAVCLAAAATFNTAMAEDYTNGDARYAEPDFDRQMTQTEAESVKADGKTELCLIVAGNRSQFVTSSRHSFSVN